MADRYRPLSSHSPRHSTSSSRDGHGEDDAAPNSPPSVASRAPTPPVSPTQPARRPTTTIKHSRPSSRVKFTVGAGEDEESDPDDDDYYYYYNNNNNNNEESTASSSLPQRPPISRRPSVAPPPRSTDSSYLEHHSADEDGNSVPFPPLAEDEDTPEAPTSAATATASTVTPTLSDSLSKTTSLGQKGRAIHSAYQRAQRLAASVRRPSFLGGPQRSATTDEEVGLTRMDANGSSVEKNTLPHDDSPFSDAHAHHPPPPPPPPQRRSQTAEANRIVRQMTMRDPPEQMNDSRTPPSPGYANHPYGEEDPLDYLQSPPQYRMGILANLLKLYQKEEHQQQQEEEERERQQLQRPAAARARPPMSRGASYDQAEKSTQRTKQKWYDKSPNQSSTSLLNFTPKRYSPKSPSSPSKPSPAHSPSPSTSGGDGLNRSRSSGMLNKAAEKILGSRQQQSPQQPGEPPRLEDEIRITVHIAAILSRQKYLTKLCEALMRYGAPTHRLEEYLSMTARVLEIDAQFLYLPGCMFVSFGDAATHTTDLRLLRHGQGVDLGKLLDVHEIYKEVVHDVVGVEEATGRLDAVVTRKQKFNKWWLIFLYGCASASVGPFAFDARPIDMPISFVLGCLVGAMNYLAAPRSILYANVFELTAAMATSFLARAFGSIRSSDGETVFCFSALAQSGIALILPGYIVLASSLELQSRNLLAGSVRLVFAIIYSLVLGFGMMLGTSFYGSIDSNASSAHHCSSSSASAGASLNAYAQRFPFVILLTLCLVLVNQSKWKQAPMMIVTSFTGYIVNFFSARHFSSNTQIANALGAFAIGVIGNLYSRLHHGLAAAAMLPAIFVQVPSGLAATGSLISGLAYANEMNNDSSSSSGGSSAVGNATTPAELNESLNSSKVYGNVVFDLAYGMVQVSLAITVGLFLAALVVYPLGKRRSGLFSF